MLIPQIIPLLCTHVSTYTRYEEATPGSNPILLTICKKFALPSDIVRMSASCFWVGMRMTLISLDVVLSLTTWCWIVMCVVLSCNTGLFTSLVALRLSQERGVGMVVSNLRSCNSVLVHVIFFCCLTHGFVPCFYRQGDHSQLKFAFPLWLVRPQLWWRCHWLIFFRPSHTPSRSHSMRLVACRTSSGRRCPHCLFLANTTRSFWLPSCVPEVVWS